MKLILVLGLCLLLLVVESCSKATHYQVTMASDEPWKIGEAKWCAFDGEYMEMHCFPPSSLATQKHNYLVTAYFDKPVEFDTNHFDLGSKTYPYAISCRLDSTEKAFCVKGK